MYGICIFALITTLLLLYVTVNCLMNLSVSELHSVDGRMMDESWIGKDSEGNGRGLTVVQFRNLLGGMKEFTKLSLINKN